MSSEERGDLDRGRTSGPLGTIYDEAEADILPRLGQDANTLDECIEMVKESIEEIYAEKLEEMRRGFLCQIEALTGEAEELRDEVRRLRREQAEREAGLGEARVREIIEQGVREEFQLKFEALESELLDKFQADTEDLMARVQDEIEELLVSKGLTRERRMEIEEQVREELRRQAAPEQPFDENHVGPADAAPVRRGRLESGGPPRPAARGRLSRRTRAERAAAAPAVRAQREEAARGDRRREGELRPEQEPLERPHEKSGRRDHPDQENPG